MKRVALSLFVAVFVGFLLTVSYLATGQVVPGNLPVSTDQHAFVVAHISSVVHVQVSGIGTSAASLSVRCVNTAGTAFADCGGGAGSGDTVNVFHQSTIRHVSSVTHIVGYAGAALHVQGMGLAGASHGGVVTIQGITGMNAVSVSQQADTTWNINHISSVLHVSGRLTGAINIAHSSSVVHISAAGTPWSFNMALAIRCVNTGATAFESCGGTVTSDVINVFHQSTIRHISSVSHIAGPVSIIDRAGNYVTVTGGELNVTCTGCSAAAVVEVDHVSSVTHVFGRSMLVGRDGTYVSVTGGELNVTCTGCSAASVVAVSHVSSVTHVSGRIILQNVAGAAVTVTGTALDVNCTGCSAASVVAVSHVSSAIHIGGTIMGAAFHIQGLGTPGNSHGGILSIQGVAGGNAIVVGQASQSGGSRWVIDHLSSVLHTAGNVSQVAGVTLPLGSGLPIGHISSVTHISGNISQIGGVRIPLGGGLPIGHISGAVHLAGNVVDNANNAIRVTGVTVFTIFGAVDHVATQVHVAGLGISPQFTMFRVNCGATAATAVSVTTTRKRVILQNVGTLPIYIGGGHVTVTTANAFTLHAVSAAQNAATTSRLELTDFQGRVDCISDGPGQTLEVLQVIGGR